MERKRHRKPSTVNLGVGIVIPPYLKNNKGERQIMIILKELKTKEELNKLYDLPTLTFEGCTTGEENLNYLYEWLKNNNALINEDLNLYLIKGKTMNNVYELEGNNKYKQRLNIIAINYQSVDITKLITKRFELGGRWFSDIIDNNERRY